jgi:hypothetical protein
LALFHNKLNAISEYDRTPSVGILVWRQTDRVQFENLKKNRNGLFAGFIKLKLVKVWRKVPLIFYLFDAE